MTREEAKHFWPIIKAYSDGKTIEYLLSDGKWANITEDFLFDNSHERYRVKQEAKYRPFTSKDECWDEMQKHQPVGWIKNKKNGNFYCIGEVSWSDAYRETIITFSTSEMLQHSSVAVYNEYTFADGTPFGIKEE